MTTSGWAFCLHRILENSHHMKDHSTVIGPLLGACIYAFANGKRRVCCRVCTAEERIQLWKSKTRDFSDEVLFLKPKKEGEHVCLVHCFQMCQFLPSRLKPNPGTGSAAFSNISILGALKRWSMWTLEANVASESNKEWIQSQTMCLCARCVFFFLYRNVSGLAVKMDPPWEM